MLRRFSVLLVLLCGTAAPAHAAPEIIARLIAEAVQLEHGEGMARDTAQAALLYCQAARLGSPEAQYAFGWMLANGRGVPRDDAVAWRLFSAAADQGHGQAARLVQALPVRPDAPLPACMAADLPLRVNLDPDPWAASPADYPPASVSVRHIVERLAPAYEVDPELAMAVIAVESGFRANAVSPKNAQGLMQLIPETAQRFQVADPFDPESNVRGGLAYLRRLLTLFDGDVGLVAAAYNAGEGAVVRHRGIPPYRETREYVTRIARLYSLPVHRYYRSSSNDPLSKR
ncbi:lytic transglycosylase domain-containing protein [Pseudoduganella lutea]|uniref:Lytic transglycosylase n=1 Tax=Pseudoduganella lutea TaxID=321985 RepID=A0A4P6KXM8_9BURK|nr:transglycosylase SLT domain-containing protein [Pseudoduganella lutea]QBE63604.1 lytic transglycosylase [Pseudoduganella lutea]